MALAQNLWLMQWAAAIGLYGLGILAALICAAPATIATGANPRTRFGPSAAAAIALVGMALYGAERLGPPDPVVAGVRLRLVQPNLPQDAKFRPENRADIVDRYIELSQRLDGGRRAGADPHRLAGIRLPVPDPARSRRPGQGGGGPGSPGSS